MTKRPSFRMLVIALAALSSISSGQEFVGSDNFNSGATTAWAFSYRLNSATQGALDFSNNRLDATQAAGGTGNLFRTWEADAADTALNSNAARTTASFTTSWNMDISVTNQLSGLTGDQFLSVGIQARSGSDYFASFLAATPSGLVVRRESTGVVFTTATATSNSDVRLRISWDASAQQLSTAYSFDSGASYTTLGTGFSVSSWTADAPSANGFNMETFMNANLGSSLAAGTAFMDNFSVSAVPEPSSFAALAGLAVLGLAATRRRARV